MPTDFKVFKELTPERRIPELQKLIGNLKKEIDDRQKEIKEAEFLIAQADEEARLLEQVEIPERRAPAKEPEKVEDLVKPKEEKRPRQVELEKLLATAPPRSGELFEKIAHRPVQELYGELKNIYQRQEKTGIETEKDRELVYAIRKGLEEKKKDIEEGQYRPAAKSKHLMTAAEQMAINMYQSASTAYKN